MRTVSTSHSSGRPAPKVRPELRGPRKVEILLIGRELLSGQIADGNARHVADFFTARGDQVRRVTTVDDDPVRIAGVLREILGRSPNVLVVTGGLGPTRDDCTLEAIAEVLGQPLREAAAARDMVETAYVRMHKARLTDRAGMTVTREKLCRLPVGTTPVANPFGVAPGMAARMPGGTHIFALPGKPEEMRPMLAAAVDAIRELAAHGHRARQEIEAPLPDESVIAPLLERLSAEFPQVTLTTRTVGSGKKSARVLITVESVAATPEEANGDVAGTIRRLLAIAGGGG